MEVSVIAKSQAKIAGADFGNRELGLLNSKVDSKIFGSKSKICFTRSSRFEKLRIRLSTKAAQMEPVQSQNVDVGRRSKSLEGVKLYVGLPLDAVSTCNAINHSKAIAAGLKALKLLGVEGVELPVWWGIVEKETTGKYEWSGYLTLAEMVQNAGLKLHVSLCFHGSNQPRIPLPEWISKIGESDPNIYFTDRYRQQYKDCLSLSVDNLPVLNGKTPIQVYHEFCESFRSSFSNLIGSTISGVSMSLGPDGELRYPSQRQPKSHGVGEFQCYDKNMLSSLKQHAEASGNPLYGLGGPHDAPSYNEMPNANNFFKDHGGSWESHYGDFFLSWYSSELIDHGDRLLSLASSIFGNTEATVYGKVPLMHSWYKTRSHPSELTAGFYNTASRDGYEAVAEMFARNSTKMILPGMDLSDQHQPQELLSSPESLISQIKSASRKHGVMLSGQNSSSSGTPGGFDRIKNNLEGESVELFTYQRLGAYFFSPEHFPSFAEFVRSVHQPELHSDDLPIGEDDTASSSPAGSVAEEQMQAA
ncbi:inactive beta-amylase 9-like isoform X2 [Cucurbita pepo subsp. pepo]|uniref:inactive beta-amylase 9-like isoform X2 n=1 Tax=Cucurbita pepo subsp. pepo TaxID=3664 RepID=UPI000C9D5D85|nr:inactive beta-amylase 9-like isoform X2 [Cucurbita pepo subsp. pepo]